MSQSFHQIIRERLNIDGPAGRFFWDPACGGSHRVSLFRDANRSSSGRYSCPDGVLVIDSEVRLIVEIEEATESGFSPHRISGKFSTSALCQFLILPGRATPVRLANVTFLQVVNTAGLKPASRKLEQYRNVERDIQDRSLPIGCIKRYRLISGDAQDRQFQSVGSELQQVVKTVFEESAAR